MAILYRMEIEAKLAWMMMTCRVFANYIFENICNEIGAKFLRTTLMLCEKTDKWELENDTCTGIDLQEYNWISVGVNYDTSSIGHQCAVYQKDKIFYLYDPYGTFKKNNKSYYDAFRKQIQCQIGEHTLHNHPLDSKDNIQTIMLEYNNAHHRDFYNEYTQLLNRHPMIAQKIEAYFAKHPNELKEIQQDIDHNRIITDVISIIWKCEGSAFNSFLELFWKYNSKLCVSITAVEMAAIFSNQQQSLYELVKTNPPNQVILSSLYELFKMHPAYNKLHFLFREPLHQICACISKAKLS